MKDAVCRRPACFARTTVYLENVDVPPVTGFYVYNCPKCGKEVPFPAGCLETVENIPPGAVIARSLE